MRIVSSDVSLASSNISIKTSTVQENLRKWDRESELTYSYESMNDRITAGSMKKRDIVELTQSKPHVLKNDASEAVDQQKDNVQKSIREEFIGDVKLQIMKDIIEIITGKKIEVLDPADLQEGDSADAPAAAPQDPAAEQGPRDGMALEGWGIDYQYRETHYEKEGFTFNAAGAVTTADGKNIDFNVSMEMSRETYDEINISLKAGDALKDPLVIDLANMGAGFSDVKFEFDIDLNGINELLRAPRAGTGFLAYDRNGNGIVDDGSELFGPQTGNGFSELAALDNDKNGWIDENDSAWNNLKVWQKGADGTDQVSSLLDSGVGAIYTGSTATPFTITAGDNDLAAVLRESGVYLKENGGAGAIQEVDIAV